MAKPKKFIVGGLLNIAGGGVTAGISYAQRQKALRQLAQIDQAESSNIMSMAARNRVARQETDSTAATDAAGRATASQFSAAQEAGGARAVQSIGPSAQRAQEEAVARSLARFGEYGASLSEQDDASVLDASRARSAPRIRSLQSAADAATQSMIGGFATAAAGAAQTIGGLPKPGQKDKAQETTSNLGTRSLGTQLNFPNVKNPGFQFGAPAKDNYESPAGNIVLDEVSVTPSIQAQGEKAVKTPAQQLREMNPMYLFNRGLLEKVPTQKEGGMVDGSKALKTPGDFSHKTNPIDVIKGGKKIAEMTGGEYIFNPKQSQKLRNLSGQGESTLHKFVRELLSKSQFK